MERLTERVDEDYLKVLLTGTSGSGKTRFGATAPRPLILLSERQGMRTIRDTAKLLGRPMPEVLLIRNLQDYRQVLRGLHGPKDQPLRVYAAAKIDTPIGKEPGLILEMNPWPETIVIDSLTDACELVRAEVLADSPPQKGEDGLDVISMRHWGEFRERATKLVRSFRDVPLHVIFLCLQDERITETSNGVTTRYIGPSLATSKMPPSVTAAVNVAGIMLRAQRPGAKTADGKEGDREIRYAVKTAGPDWMEVKPYRPLRDVEVPDFADWLRRIRAERSGDVAGAKAEPIEVEEEDGEAPAQKAAPSRKRRTESTQGGEA